MATAQPEEPAKEIVELLHGLGAILMAIDSRVEEGLKARAQLQATLDRVAENQRLRDEARERKQRSLLRRILPF